MRQTFLGILIGAAIPLILTFTSAVYATGTGSPSACQTPTTTLSGNDNLLVYIAPLGNIVTGVCIHSGTNMFGGNKHSEVLSDGVYENGCYRVSGVGTQTVTVTRISVPSPTCQGLSHVDVIDGPAPSPSTTPSTTPIPFPSATPIATSSAIPSSTPIPSVSPSPTSTPTATPTPSASSTPTVTPSLSPSPGATATPTSSSNTSSTNLSSQSTSSNTSSNSSNTNNEGAVLGASSQNSTASEEAALEGAVLGASVELPATGIPTPWVILGISSLLSGTGLIKLGLKR